MEKNTCFGNYIDLIYSIVIKFVELIIFILSDNCHERKKSFFHSSVNVKRLIVLKNSRMFLSALGDEKNTATSRLPSQTVAALGF